jgi:hypothetical protein
MFEIVWSNIYSHITPDKIKELYCDGENFVFRRKKHSSHLYFAYKKSNGGSTSQESLTYPAFPTFLLPPDDILIELEKSPKLSIKNGFRIMNWTDLLGEFYCNLDKLTIDIPDNASKSVKRKLATLTVPEKLIKHLSATETKDDEYIYSIYYIQKKSDNSYSCYHLSDITQKYTGEYSEKLKKYTVNINPYTFTFENGLVTSKYNGAG